MSTTSMPVAGAGSRTEADVPLLALSEVALGAVTLVAVLGLRRVFLDADWFGPLALQVVAAHGLAVVLRRRGASLNTSSLFLVLGAGLAVAWIYAGDTTTFGVPTGETLDVIGTMVRDASTAFPEVKAPTEALPGFLVLSSVAVWVGVALADWAAFRVDAPIEATLPTATLFVIGAIYGADVDRLLLSVGWVVVVLAFLLFRRADRLGRSSTWVGERRRTGPRSLLLLGGVLILTAVVVAAFVAPRLPGAESEAVVALTEIGEDGPGTRVTVSPLVDIRTRLVDQADVEVFTVRSPVRSYWRLTSLDEFDGQRWVSSGSYGTADGDLDDGVPVASDRISFDQSFAISALAQIWLPAAYEPQSVEAGVDLRYDEVSGTLIVEDDGTDNTSDGVDYRVTSALPQHDADALRNASGVVPEDVAERYLGLPADFPDSVRSLAGDLTAGIASDYEAALALQDFFRNEFTYDLDVGPGHGEDAIEDFLFATRTGYCEQFAGSFAAMARSIGLPARVAVGFTPGLTSPSDPTLYRVRGQHAHAWPEVYLGEYGWVLFEPTPGRGAPFAEQYTGVPEQQVASDSGDPSVATTAPSPPSTEATGPTEFPSTSQPVPEFDEVDTAAPDDDPGSPWPGRIIRTLLAALVAAALYVAGVLGVTAWRRSRRRQAAVEPDDRVALAWEDSMAAVRRAGVRVNPSATQRETAAVVGQRLPQAREPIGALATVAEDSTYSATPPSAEVGEVALGHAGEVERIADASMAPRDRLLARVHPRRFLDD